MSEAIEARLADLGRRLAERENQQADSLAAAWRCAETLHGRVGKALDQFHQVVQADAPQLVVELGAPRVDDKHMHAIQFELARGRHRAVVTVKSRGEVTLVGPFRSGKTEGPCRSFPFGAESEIEAALGDFLCAFVEAAATP